MTATRTEVVVRFEIDDEDPDEALGLIEAELEAAGLSYVYRMDVEEVPE